jgi:hypothetical protein
MQPGSGAWTAGGKGQEQGEKTTIRDAEIARLCFFDLVFNSLLVIIQLFIPL